MEISKKELENQKVINQAHKDITRTKGKDYAPNKDEIQNWIDDNSQKVKEITKGELEEEKKKGDRCTRIAKRKYDVWPSAYASGAVVKCRQGKIWKGLNEEEEDLDEKWSEKYKRSIDCNNPKGFSQKAHCKGRLKEEEESLNEKTDFSKEKEQGLHGWFARQGGKGKSKGWVDCNTCRDGKCKSCGRKEGESRSKYPACRPTPSACKSKGRGDSWGKKSINEDAKSGTPEELIELLKLLPIDETAKELTNEIMSDLKAYYDNEEELLPIKTYIYQPKDKCIQPYELEVDFILKGSSAVVSIGYAETHYIQLYILKKDVKSAYARVLALPNKIFNVIKHECSHYYLSQKNIENCLYLTHADGMKKYYYDRQELVLHSREIFDDLDKQVLNWRNMPLENIKKIITNEVSVLRDKTRIHFPFPKGLQNKYVAFIMNNYIIPNHNSNNKVINEQTKQDIQRELKLNEIKNTFKRLLK